MAQLATDRNISSIIQTSQQKAISTGLLTFTLIVVLLWGSLRPTVSTILTTTRKLSEREAALSNLQQHNANLTKLKTAQLELADDLTNLNYYFPYDGDFSLFVVNLNEIATDHDLTLQSVSFSEKYASKIEEVNSLKFDEMRPITFNVALEGDPNDVAKFLSYMENTPFLPKILGVGYSPGVVLKSNTVITVSMLLYQMNSPATAYE